MFLFLFMIKILCFDSFAWFLNLSLLIWSLWKGTVSRSTLLVYDFFSSKVMTNIKKATAFCLKLEKVCYVMQHLSLLNRVLLYFLAFLLSAIIQQKTRRRYSFLA